MLDSWSANDIHMSDSFCFLGVLDLFLLELVLLAVIRSWIRDELWLVLER